MIIADITNTPIDFAVIIVKKWHGKYIKESPNLHVMHLKLKKSI